MKKININDGLITNRRDQQLEKHPIQTLQELSIYAEEEQAMKTYSALYGSQIPMMLTIERTALAQSRRLFGQKTSLLGLEISMNKLDKIDFTDFLGYDNPNIQKENIHDLYLKKLNQLN